jgi:hypothetical protein
MLDIGSLCSPAFQSWDDGLLGLLYLLALTPLVFWLPWSFGFLGLLGPSSLGPWSFGFLGLLGPSSLGPSSLGPSSLGPSSLGPSSLGPSSLGPSSLGPWFFGFLGLSLCHYALFFST